MAIKKIDPKATWKLISSYDDAVIKETEEELEALKTGEMDEKGKEKSNPTRYQRYMDDLDEAKLRLDPAASPTRFVIRCLLNDEQALLNSKYLEVDTVKKTYEYKNGLVMFLEVFNLACLGIDEGGKIVKITANDIGYGPAAEIGSVIHHFSALGKNLKK